VQIAPDGVLSYGPERAAEGTAEEMGHSLLSLLANLLELLATFIGEDLVQRALRRIWPELAASPADRDGRERP